MDKKSNIADRLLNFIFDTVAFTIMVFIILWILKTLNVDFQFNNPTIRKILAFTLYFFYYFMSEAISFSTIGKYFTGTKIVEKDSLMSPSIYRIFIRTLCRFIPLEFIFIIFTNDNRTLHDILSGTVVIRKSKY